MAASSVLPIIPTLTDHAQGTHAHYQRTYRVEDVAALLGIGRTSAYNLIKEGHFKVVRIGTAIRISKKPFDECLVALKRKAEVENQINTGTFLPPSNQTVSKFMYDFVFLYGEKKWSVSIYDSSCALIANYINPIIGNVEIQTITPSVADQYFAFCMEQETLEQ